MASSKRSLLDLLPRPKQRESKVPTKKPRKKEQDGNGEAPSAQTTGKQVDDNEQYRVTVQPTLSAPASAPSTSPNLSEETELPKETAAVTDEDALVMKALEEDQLLSKKGNKKALEIEFKEISQDTLKGGTSVVQREVDAIGLALAADEDEDDKVALPAYTLSKEAKRKHQITTLYQNMKQNETKLLTKESQSAKTKRETERKYGWR